MELYSHEAEQIVLGSVLTQAKTLPEVAKRLKDTYFYFEKHQAIYSSILSLSRDSVAADIVTVADDLSKKNKLVFVGGSSYLAEVVSKSIGFP